MFNGKKSVFVLLRMRGVLFRLQGTEYHVPHGVGDFS